VLAKAWSSHHFLLGRSSFYFLSDQDLKQGESKQNNRIGFGRNYWEPVGKWDRILEKMLGACRAVWKLLWIWEKIWGCCREIGWDLGENIRRL